MPGLGVPCNPLPGIDGARRGGRATTIATFVFAGVVFGLVVWPVRWLQSWRQRRQWTRLAWRSPQRPVDVELPRRDGLPRMRPSASEVEGPSPFIPLPDELDIPVDRTADVTPG